MNPPPPSFDQLLAHRPFVRSLARKLTSDDSLAEDIEQQAWIVALDRPPRHPRAARAWFSRVLKNAMLSELDSSRRRSEREHLAHRDRVDEATAADADDDRMREQLGAALDALPRHYAEVVRLRYYEGKSAREIAEMLELPLNTVRTRLHRSIERMRDWFDRHHGHDRRKWMPGLLLLAIERPRPPVRSMALAAAVAAVSGAGLLLFATAGPREAEPLAPVVAQLEPAVGAEALVAAELPLEQVRESIPPPPAPSTDAGLQVVARWQDGSPAAGVGLHLEPLRTARHEGIRQTVLEASGMASWSELSAGRWTVFSTAGPPEVVELAPDAVTEVTLELGVPRPLSVRLAGTGGASPAGHAIHLSAAGDSERMIWVGESDVNGLFDLTHFGSGSWVMAGGNHGALSSLVSLDHPRFRSDAAPRVVLTVARPRRSVEVTVLDANGAPVSDAMVRLGDAVRFPAARQVDGLVRIAPRMQAPTGEDGKRKLVSTSKGPVGLSVWHEAYAPWSGVVHDRDREVVVQLERGARLEGTLRDASGDPVAGGTVRWKRGSRSHTVHAGVDGHYRIPTLPAGAYELVAFEGEGEDALIARGSVELVAGEDGLWSPSLEHAPCVRGRALDASGRPLAGCQVALMETRPADPLGALAGDLGEVRWARVDARGNFAFGERGAIEDVGGRALFLFRSRELTSAALGALDEVPFGATDLLLGPCVSGTADARLSVRTRSGTPGDAATRILLTSPRTPLALYGRAEGSAWVFDELPPGEWSVVHWGPDALPWRVATVQLAVGQALDLEVEAPEAPGSIELRVHDGAGEPAPPRSVELVRLAEPRLTMEGLRKHCSGPVSIEPDGRITAQMPPGEYLVVMRNKRKGDVSCRVIVRSGECTRREVEVASGRRQALRVELPEASARTRELRLAFHSLEGDVRFEDLLMLRTHALSYDLERRLPDEELVVHARLTSETGEVASATVPLASPFQRSSEEPVVIRLQELSLASTDSVGEAPR